MRVRTSTLFSLLIAGLALAGGLASWSSMEASTVSDLEVKIREWQGPTKGAHPHDPAVAPDGSLWFTEQMVSKLGRLDPATGDFKEYPLKGDNDGPHGLVDHTARTNFFHRGHTGPTSTNSSVARC